MKRIFHTVALTTLLAIGGQAALAQDFDKGLAAYNSGDFATALQEWRPLAEQGNATAQFNLGEMYLTGRGVPEDDLYAHMWFNIATSLGNERASEYKDITAGRMSREDISKAQAMTRECVAKNYKGC